MSVAQRYYTKCGICLAFNFRKKEYCNYSYKKFF